VPNPPKATPHELRLARQLRAQGKTYEFIAKRLGRSIKFVWNHARHATPGRTPHEGAPQATTNLRRTITRYRDFPAFNNAPPALQHRILNLARRGFDVPPSKLAAWDALAHSNVPLAERKRILNLE